MPDEDWLRRFLKDVQLGKRSIDEFNGNSGVSLWLKRIGSDLLEGEGMKLTEDQLTEYRQRYPKKSFMIFRPAGDNLKTEQL